MSMSTNPTSTPSLKFSLWLIPPDDVSAKLKEQIRKFSANGETGPLFDPHVTICGGVRCKSEEEASQLANVLEEGLRNFGSIPCLLSTEAFGAPDSWNQALYYKVAANQEFMNLCIASRELMGLDSSHWTFPPPAVCPHISLFYGINNVPDKSEARSLEPFLAERVALWKTDPSSPEGVNEWKEIKSFTIR